MSYDNEYLENELKDTIKVNMQSININSEVKHSIKSTAEPIAQKFKVEIEEVSTLLNDLLTTGIGHVKKDKSDEYDDLILYIKIKDQNQLFSIPYGAWEFLH